MTITVTQEHIENGRRGHCWTCPVALAVHSAGYPDAFIGPWTVRLNGFNDMMILMPLSAHNWISQFDRQIPVEPFSFELDETNVFTAQEAAK